ncbi:MAG: nucleotide-binding protein [Cytophagales bacterium]|nr:MAG: nucleotide-binding protein [Cytophagales bacterium]
MKKIVVDTNIIFSCLLNTQGTIGDLIFNSSTIFTFYSSSYMRQEIRKHWDKLKKISKLTDFELETAYERLLTRLTFIDEALIPASVWQQSASLVSDIDEDDVDFVALAKFLKAGLWTGDKPLCTGLKAKRFRRIYNTTDLVKLREKLMN